MKKEGNRLLFKYGFRKVVMTLPILLLLAGVWWNYEAIMEKLSWEQSGLNYSTSDQEPMSNSTIIDELNSVNDMEFEPTVLAEQRKQIASEFNQAFSFSLEEYIYFDGTLLTEKLKSAEGLGDIYRSRLSSQQIGDMRPFFYFHPNKDKGYVLLKKATGTKELYTVEKRDEFWQVVFFQRLTQDGEYNERITGLNLEKLETHINEVKYAIPHRSSFMKGLPNEIGINDEISITAGAYQNHIMIKTAHLEVKIDHPKTTSKLMTAELSKDESILAIEVIQDDSFITIYIVDMINGTYEQIVHNELSMLPSWSPTNMELLIAKGEIGSIELMMYNPVTKEFSTLDGGYYNLISIDWEKEGQFIDFVIEKEDVNNQEVNTVVDQQLILYPFSLYRYDFATGNTQKLIDLSVEELDYFMETSRRNYTENSMYRVQYKGF